MLLWATLLVLAPASGQFETAPKPVISLHPPWTPVFQGETVKLTCNGFSSSSPRKIQWYIGRRILSEGNRSTLEVDQSGYYRCKVVNSPVSDPVHLDFVSATLILQIPLPVFEGDSVVLRCQAKAKTKLDSVKIYKNDQLLVSLGENTEFNIHQASLRNNGDYHCTGVRKSLRYPVRSNTVKIQVQELFSRPVLTDILSGPGDGNQVTLSCETQLPPQKSNVMLQFCFFRNNQALESGCSNNPGLQISAIWTEYSGFYQCKAGAVISGVWKKSQITQIHVQKCSDWPEWTLLDQVNRFLQLQVPEADYVRTRKPEDKSLGNKQFQLDVPGDGAVAEVQTPRHPASGSVFEGEELLLICSGGVDPEPMNFSWYYKTSWYTKKKISSEAKYKIPVVENGHAGEYYCEAGQFTSKPVTIKVKVPVSQPVLTLSTGKAQFVEAEPVNFRCEVDRGSPEILYEFFHEDTFLWKVKISSRFASFSTIPAHSGNYYCTANNGLGPQRSEALKLSVTVPVSQPILTLHTAEAQTVEGGVVTLHCEAHRGSLHVLYQFYHEDILVESTLVPAGTGASYRFSLTAEHSGNYYCTADNGFGPKHSKTMSLSVIVPVSLPILTLRMPRIPAVVGDMMELHCEALRGSPPILYQFYHEDVILGSSQSPSGGGASFKFPLTEEHSGNYLCEASNVQKAQRSNMMILNVKVPVSRPVFTLRTSRAQAVVGDTVELQCEALRGTPPILYQFYHEHVMLVNSSAPSGGGASFNFILTMEHSGNYFCEADNGLEVQRSEVMTLKVTVPVSRPVLTLRVPRAQAVVGDEMELHCEALRGSPPILYRFYHENVTLRNDSAFSGGVSFNLSLTAEHSGNYSCEADNGLGAQQSEVVTLFITGLTKHSSGAVATGVTGALLSMAGLAAGALLFYFWLSRKAGDRSASDFSRNPSDLNPQETTYHNVPGWIELQPVYLNEDMTWFTQKYKETKRKINMQEQEREARFMWPASNCFVKAASRSRILRSKGSSVIYSQVKVACTPASGAQQSAASAPHR